MGDETSVGQRGVRKGNIQYFPSHIPGADWSVRGEVPLRIFSGPLYSIVDTKLNYDKVLGRLKDPS